MSRFDTYRVWLKGEDEAVIVRPNARDFADIEFDPGAGIKPVRLMYESIHAALMRMGFPSVPLDIESFIDETLDGMPEIVAAGDPASLDPTAAGRSEGLP